MNIKKTVDFFATIGAPISSKDHIEVLLDGLYDDYDPFITAITSRLDPYIVDNLEALLPTQKERFDKHKLVVSSILQANIVSVTYVIENQFNQISFALILLVVQDFVVLVVFMILNDLAKIQFRENASSNSWTSDKPQCQICDKKRHSIVNCCHRYDQTNNSHIQVNVSQFSST